MESFKIENLSFCYPGKEKVLDDINITINRGEFVTLCGKSGCGKTTLLRMLKPSLTPFGVLDGEIYFEGTPLFACNPKDQAGKIGFVMQNPDNQIVTEKVCYELAFGLESLGFTTPEIRSRVSEIASFFGIEGWFDKNVAELSGGQKQLLNLASVMLLDPSVLILDEPASQLDPIAAQEFFNTLEKINRELGTTIILAEHRLEDAFPMSDRVIVMDQGRIIANNTPRKVGELLKSSGHPMCKALPTPMRIYTATENLLECPLTIREGRLWLENFEKENGLNSDLIPDCEAYLEPENPIIEVKNAWFRYEKNSPDVIADLNLKIQKGDFFALVGGNGTGKTTALSLILGLNTPYRGEVIVKGETVTKTNNLCSSIISVLPQNPQSVFAKKTVYLDLLDMLSSSQIGENEKKEKVQKISALCHIENLLDSHPYDLSGGEQQRAALAKILLTSPEILLLDEPTKGMDAHFKEEFADFLGDLKANGVTIIMVSHDIEFCAEYADSCAMLFNGSIASVGHPREFFAGKQFYTTAANRMARSVLPKAVLARDVIRACGGTVEKKERQAFRFDAHIPKNEAKPAKKAKLIPHRTIFAILLFLLVIPLTIYAGTYFGNNKKYFVTSLLVMLETIIPFCMAFERRNPKAREIVVISVLCALAVASRSAFFMLPQFKPVIALIIISGITFGGETGFLVGAVTGLVSNFFFGQGPWTPWQMFAMGIIGFLAGAIFKKGILKRTKITLAAFGFLATFLIYGGIMNPASIIMWQDSITIKMLIASYMAGLPFDIIHASSTAFFLWFIAEPMIDKLERIKVKYGLLDAAK